MTDTILIFATLLYLAANLVDDTIPGRSAPRPDWMAKSRTYPLLYASGRAIVDFVEWRRGAPPAGAAEPKKGTEPANESQNRA